VYDDITVDAVSSLSDTWINLCNTGKNSGYQRTLHIVKARGMGHANNEQIFTISDKGIKFHNLEKK
jgi:circadian clock protein KaiC